MKTLANSAGVDLEAPGCPSLEVEQGFQSREPADLQGSSPEVHLKPKGPTPEALAVAHQVDSVDHPHHYARFAIEPIYFIMENELTYPVGNIIKYVCRHDAKNGVEDLKKARRYLDMMIKEAEGDPNYAG